MDTYFANVGVVQMGNFQTVSSGTQDMIHHIQARWVKMSNVCFGANSITAAVSLNQLLFSYLLLLYKNLSTYLF